MKIEVGKRYRMANGDVATIMEHVPNSVFPWKGLFGDTDNGGVMSWGVDGAQCNGAANYQLIGAVDDEVQAEFNSRELNTMPAAKYAPKEDEPLQLQVGKRYRTRADEEVEITHELNHTRGDEFSRFQGSHPSSGIESWRSDGRYYRFGESVMDLIAEIAEKDAPELPAPDHGWNDKGANGLPFAAIAQVFIEVPIIDGVSSEVAAMAALENVMFDAANNRELTRSQAVRIANWFAERYGDQMPGARA